MQPQGLGGSAGCSVPPQPPVSPQTCPSKLMHTEQTPDLLA